MRSMMAMLRPKAPDAGALYDAVVAEARRPAWYREGGVADSLDGRFAVLSTLTALAILRLEDGSEESVRHSVALTESFIADMDAQMREEGFGDPSLGKQVRLMVGALATRVDWWRRARSGELDWNDAVRLSVYRDDPPQSEAAVTFSSEALRRFNEGLGGFSDRELIEGRIG
ncbi:MAG TPA: ubiquinol-cytochrome C chaperone family protein [Sphingomicrobium sp.]|nr:ubiquinol-cytochrome C chaperone family protein [Sphingomicrobium sp.]